MSTLWTPPRETHRYSEQDLLDAARAPECGDVQRRTVRTFIALGLLDHPRRRWPGHGGGSSPGWWPRQQYDLWCTLLRQRQQLIAREGHRPQIHAVLSNVVVGAWLYFGEAAGIPLTQVRRAMQTWSKTYQTVGSDAEARRAALGFVRLAAHPSATNRRDLRANLAEMLYTGRYPGREDLLYHLDMLVDPHGRGDMKGPDEAPLSAENLADMILSRAEIVKTLGSGADKSPDGLWEWARFILLWTRGWYQAAQPRLADDPSLRKHPELARIYAPEDFESMINAACKDLLSVLGVSDLAQHATHLPLEQRPGPWLAGRVQLRVNGRQQLSAVLHPDGSRQIYLAVSVQLIWADSIGDMR